ncbi:uncharacterized protein LOC112904720 [Agrilus planipennis]|uniref:Uncharacterized protein LOC112904720 n=1 Tax=Agrilus planipennis TaxID=224129 RepID=A0A7F5R5W5_AGRPL|nr:uncharacterized protein LOC112904720 [Agrilus planipennis]
MDDEIRNTYFDDSNNVCFKELPLEEYVPLAPTGSRVVEPSQLELEDRIKRLERQLKLNATPDGIELQQIEKKFVLEKFDRKQNNPTEWLHRFEEECNRNQIITDSLKIQALNFYLIGPAKDWYDTIIRKIGLFASWTSWKDSFLNVFVDKGWSIVKKAFNFKFLGGSLVDYALAKEKLCLDVEPNGSEISRINLIVVGLPSEAQEKLDRELITSLDELYTELRKLEGTFQRKKTENPSRPRLNDTHTAMLNKRLESQPKNESQRKPCSFCASLGFKNRYHSVAEYQNHTMNTRRDAMRAHAT